MNSSVNKIQSPAMTNISSTALYEDTARVITQWLESSDEIVSPAGGTHPGSTSTLQQFYAAFRAGSDCGYLRDYYIGSSHGELELAIYSHLKISNWFLDPASKVCPPWVWLFVGGDGTGSPMHLDVMNSAAWNIVLEGEKHWEILPPALGVDQGFLPRSLLSQPGVSRSREIVTFVQRPGDLVLVPSGWCHRVLNVGKTVAVTGNYVADENSALVRHYLLRIGDEVSVNQLDALAQVVRKGRETG